jgi:hypothetical protein
MAQDAGMSDNMRGRDGHEQSNKAYAAWLQWRERCALDRCTEEARRGLVAFAGRRYRTLARRAVGVLGLHRDAVPALSDREVWHLLETHLVAGARLEGKGYKLWLFERGAPTLDAVEAGATVLLRTCLRDYLSAELPRREARSLDAVLASSGETGGPCLADLLAGGVDPREPVAEAELRRLAEGVAAAWEPRLDGQVRAALLAAHIGCPLAEAAAWVGVGRRTLARALQAFGVRMRAEVRGQFADLSTVECLELESRAIALLQQRVVRVSREEAGSA